MTPDLPRWLRSAVDELAQALGVKTLAQASQRITAHYREGNPSGQAILSQADVAAYVAARMPATYAAVSAALDAVLLQMPDFNPESLLDIGAGPGTASFAAFRALPQIAEVTMLDNNLPFLALAKRLAMASPDTVLQIARIIPQDFSGKAELPKADLVIAAYSMVEMPKSALPQLAERLWNASSGVMLIVEPGTPAGFANILAMRQAFIELGANIIAPCPGNIVCPMMGSDWCHFSQRLPRSKLQMSTKAARVPFEDERYSYLAASRENRIVPAARILAPPVENKAGITFKLCTVEGLKNQTTPSRDKVAFKRAKKQGWGDLLVE